MLVKQLRQRPINSELSVEMILIAKEHKQQALQTLSVHVHSLTRMVMLTAVGLLETLIGSIQPAIKHGKDTSLTNRALILVTLMKYGTNLP